MEEGLAGVALAVSQGLGERLEARLRQQENADDADKGAAGKDDVVKEIALLIVELHDGSSQHAEPGARQYQADTAPSAITQKMILHYYIVQKKNRGKEFLPTLKPTATKYSNIYSINK